jgi:single-stranded DNA-binding protein
MNKFFGVGYLVADLESRVVGDKTVANGAIAINRDYSDDKVDFINISIWSGSDVAIKYMKKGMLVAVMGQLNIDRKNDKMYTKINVEKFRFFSEKKKDATPESQVETSNDKEIDFNEFFGENTNTDLPF